jgi:hypothetical protein
LLKQERQNEWYNEFLKLKKNCDEEYLNQKEIEDNERKYKNVCLTIPYRSMSELNAEDEINGNQIIIQEEPKCKTQSIGNFILKK